MKNILICSAGRRVELVQSFCEQARALIPSSLVYAIDCQAHLSSACQVADFTSSCPRVNDVEYTNFLLTYSQQNNIGLVIPTIDTELALLSREKDQFKRQGIEIVVSSMGLISACRDKRKTGNIFNLANIDYPYIYPDHAIQFPCFVKPYDGSSSMGAQKLEVVDDLTDRLLLDEKMMFMEFVDPSYAEFTVDTYFSEGRLKCLVPRKRLETRAGEVSKGMTVKSWLYDFLVGRLSEVEGAKGCLTIQVFANDDKQHCIGLEINPRFGGGYPLTYAAGANFPGWLIQEYLLGEEVHFFADWEPNLLMLRYDAKVLVHNAQFI